MGPQGEAAVAQMEAMGFPRSDIDRAMRAAFFNPDRAIEYLLNVSLRESDTKE
jgi:UV excision repair protein RAD23